MKIAIILPVYNVENRLAICLDSIFKQTYGNFVVVAINDGSTDNSLEILKKFDKDKRLIIINQDNKGLSGARNRGLFEILNDTTIDIVTFIDSDDYIKPDYLEHCINVFNDKKINCYYSGHFEEIKKSIIEVKPSICGFCDKKSILKMLCTDTLSVTVAGKFYKRTICNDAFFPPYNPGEDFCGNIMLLLNLNGEVFIDDYCGYYYYRNDDQPSITRSKRNFKKRINCIYANKFVYLLVEESECKKIQKTKIINSFFHEMPYFICAKLTDEEKEELKELKKWIKKQKLLSKNKNIRVFLYKYLRPIYIILIKIKYSKYYKNYQ